MGNYYEETFGGELGETIEFMERNLRVQKAVGHGTVPLVLNDVQIDMFRRSKAARMERDWTVTVKPRQVGSTTGWLAFGCAKMQLNPGIYLLFVAQDKDTLAAIRRKMLIIVASMADSLGPKFGGLSSNSAQTLAFNNGSTLVWAYSGYTEDVAGRVGRGDTFNLAFFTEMAYWEDAQTSIDSLLPALEKSKAPIVIDSTANGTTGAGETFHRFAKMAMSGKAGMTLLFWAWWIDKSYTLELDEEQEGELLKTLSTREQWLVRDTGLTLGQIAWRRLKIDTHGEKFFEIYPESAEDAFVISDSDSVFSSATLAMVARTVEASGAPLNHEDDKWIISPGAGWSPKLTENFIRLWSEPKEEKSYVLGFDPSLGTPDGDPQGLVVVDDSGEIALTARLRLGAMGCAALIQRIATYFQAMIVVERSSNGELVLRYVVEPMDEDFAVKERADRILCEPYGKVYDGGLVSMNQHVRGGVVDGIVRSLGSSTAVRDPAMLHEMRVFADNGRKIEHKKGEHDDMLFAYGHAYRVVRKLSDKLKSSMVGRASKVNRRRNAHDRKEKQPRKMVARDSRFGAIRNAISSRTKAR